MKSKCKAHMCSNKPHVLFYFRHYVMDHIEHKKMVMVVVVVFAKNGQFNLLYMHGSPQSNRSKAQKLCK